MGIMVIVRWDMDHGHRPMIAKTNMQITRIITASTHPWRPAITRHSDDARNMHPWLKCTRWKSSAIMQPLPAPWTGSPMLQSIRAYTRPEGPRCHDHNFARPVFSRIADALTSVLAIAALLFGKYMGLTLARPDYGIVGAVIISRWSGTYSANQSILLDGGVKHHYNVKSHKPLKLYRSSSGRFTSWRGAPDHHAIMVSIVSHSPKDVSYFNQLLSRISWNLAITMWDSIRLPARAQVLCGSPNDCLCWAIIFIRACGQVCHNAFDRSLNGWTFNGRAIQTDNGQIVWLTRFYGVRRRPGSFRG